MAKGKKTKKKDFLEDLQRVQAEFENYVKRVEKEKLQLQLHSKSELLLELIQIKEDLDKAKTNLKDPGIDMISDNLKKILEHEQVQEIPTLGHTFNHNLHEVIKKNGTGETIIEEVQKGYMLGDRILRPSKVIIGGN